ncbi:RNase H family protein [Lacticaseibacillus yichunensis]|uniref:RNase H family protein n=1 Tax=Lacticaseibacillus yichunensis TaxID=2486015 RepID=A0ABW4CPU5_9LACO|nr:RNase H family protein [Lacticaseibacillus yichunensis]
MAQKPFYYALAGENFTGLFPSNPARQAKIKALKATSRDGKNNTIIQSFTQSQKAEADKFVNSPQLKEFFSPFDHTKGLFAFIDGSFTKGVANSGSGVILVKDGVAIQAFSITNTTFSTSNQITGELNAALIAIQWAKANGYDRVDLVHDYVGTVATPYGWGQNSPVSIEYAKLLPQAASGIDVHFHNVGGHTGVKFNEWADQMARNAVSSEMHPNPTLTTTWPADLPITTSLPTSYMSL